VSLRFGLSVNQIGDGFGLSEIEAPILDCAAREFPALRSPKAKRPKRGKQTVDDRAAAMHVQFDDVFARVARRPAEEDGQASIDQPSVCVEEGPGGQMARGWRRRTAQLLQGLLRSKPRDSDDCDPGSARRRRERKDRVRQRAVLAGRGGVPPPAARRALSHRNF